MCCKFITTVVALYYKYILQLKMKAINQMVMLYSPTREAFDLEWKNYHNKPLILYARYIVDRVIDNTDAEDRYDYNEMFYSAMRYLMQFIYGEEMARSHFSEMVKDICCNRDLCILNDIKEITCPDFDFDPKPKHVTSEQDLLNINAIFLTITLRVKDEVWKKYDGYLILYFISLIIEEIGHRIFNVLKEHKTFKIPSHNLTEFIPGSKKISTSRKLSMAKIIIEGILNDSYSAFRSLPFIKSILLNVGPDVYMQDIEGILKCPPIPDFECPVATEAPLGIFSLS